MKYFLIFPLISIFSFGLSAQTNQKNAEQIELKIKDLQRERSLLNNRLNIISDSLNHLLKKLENERLNSSLPKGSVYLTKTKMVAKLRNKPSITGNVILTIPKNKEIKVYEYLDYSYWKIGYKNKIGFVNEVVLFQTDEMKSVAQAFTNKKDKEFLDQRIESKENYRKKLEEKYGKYTASKIQKGMIWIGMTAEMARESVGYPDEINKSTGS